MCDWFLIISSSVVLDYQKKRLVSDGEDLPCSESNPSAGEFSQKGL